MTLREQFNHLDHDSNPSQTMTLTACPVGETWVGACLVTVIGPSAQKWGSAPQKIVLRRGRVPIPKPNHDSNRLPSGCNLGWGPSGPTPSCLVTVIGPSAQKWGFAPQKIVLRRGRVTPPPLLKKINISPDYAKVKKIFLHIFFFWGGGGGPPPPKKKKKMCEKN